MTFLTWASLRKLFLAPTLHFERNPSLSNFFLSLKWLRKRSLDMFLDYLLKSDWLDSVIWANSGFDYVLSVISLRSELLSSSSSWFWFCLFAAMISCWFSKIYCFCFSLWAYESSVRFILSILLILLAIDSTLLKSEPTSFLSLLNSCWAGLIGTWYCFFFCIRALLDAGRDPLYLLLFYDNAFRFFSSSFSSWICSIRNSWFVCFFLFSDSWIVRALSALPLPSMAQLYFLFSFWEVLLILFWKPCLALGVCSISVRFSSLYMSRSLCPMGRSVPRRFAGCLRIDLVPRCYQLLVVERLACLWLLYSSREAKVTEGAPAVEGVNSSRSSLTS